MGHVLALAGWPEVPVPPGAWLGADAKGRPLLLANLPAQRGGEGAAVACNEDRTIRAVIAGSVCNERQVRASLGGRHAFSGSDDAEMLVHLYEERGPQCVKALRGGFALALWDERARRFLLARDQLGLVPLYYATEGGHLAASSSLPALAAVPRLTGSWDATALDLFLTFGFVPAPATLYPAIRQLNPGELLVWEEGKSKTQRYWQLGFPERRMARPDLVRLVREQVLEALRLRDTRDGFGLLLSAGLDSAALLALTKMDRTPPARAYTVGNDEPDEEVRTAARLASRVGVEHVLVGSGIDWPAAADELLEIHGGPAGGPDAVALLTAVRRAAAETRVVLAGAGGEEVFGGGGPARLADRVAAYRRLPGLAREAALLWSRVAPLRWEGGMRSVVDAERLAPLEMYARAVSIFLPDEREELYTPEALASLGEARPWSILTGLFAEAVGTGAQETTDAIHYVEVTLRLPARLAMMTAASAAGAELRLPFADHRLAQLVASVPSQSRSTSRQRQALLRGVVSDQLPRAILRRPHRSPVPPPAGWGTGSLHELLEETLAPERLAAQGVFRSDTVERLRREHLAGRRDHAERLWAIVLATRWLGRRAAVPAVRVA